MLWIYRLSTKVCLNRINYHPYLPRILKRKQSNTSGENRPIHTPMQSDDKHSENLLDCFKTLYCISMEIKLLSFPISQFSLKGISWYSIQSIFLDFFAQTDFQIFACYNKIVTLPSHHQTEIFTFPHFADAREYQKQIDETAKDTIATGRSG